MIYYQQFESDEMNSVYFLSPIIKGRKIKTWHTVCCFIYVCEYRETRRDIDRHAHKETEDQGQYAEWLLSAQPMIISRSNCIKINMMFSKGCDCSWQVLTILTSYCIWLIIVIPSKERLSQHTRYKYVNSRILMTHYVMWS